MDKLIHQYWLSARGVVKETRLLTEIRSCVKNPDEAIEFMGELDDAASIYEAILNPTGDSWSSHDSATADEIVGYLKDLHVISKRMPVPVLLASYNKMSVKEFMKTIKCCTNFLFRYLTIGGGESKILQKLFSDIAVGIRESRIKTVSQIREQLLRRDPSNEELLPKLETMEIHKPTMARYILKKIEEYREPNKEKWSKKITLEHILPQDPNKKWKDYLKKHKMDKDELKNRLGNLTLLVGPVNSEAKNYFFDKKIKIYQAKSQLEITKALGKIKSWTTEDIDARQKELAKDIIAIWKL